MKNSHLSFLENLVKDHVQELSSDFLRNLKFVKKFNFNRN